MTIMATINELARRTNMAGEILVQGPWSVTLRFRRAVNSSAGSLCNELFSNRECCSRQVPDCNRFLVIFGVCTLCGTGHAPGSTCEGRKKGMSHENQFIIVGNPASVKPDNSLDSHFSSRFGVSSPLERHRMVSLTTLNHMPWIRAPNC